jgi:hypothetical protein
MVKAGLARQEPRSTTMVGEVAAGLASLKSAFDLARGLKDMNDAALRNAAVIDLQEKILTAQQAQAALVDRIGDLENQVAGFEAWDRQKQRYQLEKLPPSVFVYSLKPSMAEGEPPHYICAKCYERRKRSILHGSGKEQGIETFHCRECDSKFYVGFFQSFDSEDSYQSSP